MTEAERRADAAEKIASDCSELAHLARSVNLETLAYLLEGARHEAQRASGRPVGRTLE